MDLYDRRITYLESAETAQRAEAQADAAVRVMNDGEMEDFRDRAFEEPYPPKAILGRAFEQATGARLRPGDFESGKSGAVRVLTQVCPSSDKSV